MDRINLYSRTNIVYSAEEYIDTDDVKAFYFYFEL